VGLEPNKGNSVTIPADMLEKIAATNHLAIADVFRLFLRQAFPEGNGRGTLELSREPASVL
jgi:hypothetical protein